MRKVAVGIGVMAFLVLVFTCIPAASSTLSSDLVNPGFETGDLAGWYVGEAVDYVGVVSADGYAVPYRGHYMLRLGTPRYTGQPVGNNTVYQDFVVVNPVLEFSYNIFTYDYYPWNHFHYLVQDLTTPSVIVNYSQTAWGSGTGLKSTGWIVVKIDLSAHVGNLVRLEVSAGGTRDLTYGTWAYVDSTETVVRTKYNLVGVQGLNGWYVSDVDVILKAENQGEVSSLVTEYSFDNTNWITYTAPFTISGEGMTAVYYRSKDPAGVVEPTNLLIVKIDKTAPETHAVLEGSFDGYNYTSDVTVSLYASDAVSGVASTLYSLDDSSWLEYSGSLVVSTEGSHLLKYKSIDKAGNIEVEKNVGFNITRDCGSPLEFIIRFDVISKDVKVYNSQTGEEVIYVVLDDKQVGWELRKYTLESWNKSAELHLKYGKGGNDVKIRVVAMRYNGGPILAAPGNELKVEYSRDKSGSIKEMEQRIVVRDILQAFAKYSAKKSETEINLKLGENSSRETVAGIAALKLLTDNGSLKYGGY